MPSPHSYDGFYWEAVIMTMPIAGMWQFQLLIWSRFLTNFPSSRRLVSLRSLPPRIHIMILMINMKVWLTAYQLLHFVAKIQPGDSVLVHAGGSGVGRPSHHHHHRHSSILWIVFQHQKFLEHSVVLRPVDLQYLCTFLRYCLTDFCILVFGCQYDLHHCPIYES